MSSRKNLRLGRSKLRKTVNVPVCNKSGSMLETSNALSIWCHLCKCNFSNNEEFRMHIMKKHRPSSHFYEGSSDTDESAQNENCATHFMDSEDGLKLKHEIDSDAEEDSDENEEKPDFSGGAKMYDQTLYSNISETAVSPRSSLPQQKRKNSRNFSKPEFDLSMIKKEIEDVNSSANFNSSITNAPAFQTFPSSANQITPQIISIATNQISPQFNPMVNNPQFILNNNQLQLINPYNQQSSCFVGNQPALQFNSVINPVPKSQNGYVFNAKNVIEWNNKLKKCSKNLKYPLRENLLRKIKNVHEIILDNLSVTGVCTDTEKETIIKIFQDLELMICKHHEFVTDRW